MKKEITKRTITQDIIKNKKSLLGERLAMILKIIRRRFKNENFSYH